MRHSRDYDHRSNGHRDSYANGHTSRQSHDRRRPKKTIGTLTAHLVAAVGEFVGTFMFLYFAFAGQIMIVFQAADVSRTNGLASSQQNIFTALLYGLSLLVNVWAFYRISGGLFNPAVSFPTSRIYKILTFHQVTLGLVISGALPPIRGLFLFPAQLIAAMCAAAVVQAMVPGDISATQTTLSPGTSMAQGVFIEMFMTAELVFVVLMLAAEKSKDTFIAPIGIGLALFVAMMGGTLFFLPFRRVQLELINTGVHYTGGSLNPARSLGPAVASKTFSKYHWIYWIGPALGAVVAAGFYHFVKFFDYEQVNPGQDSAGRDSDED
jgi:aquaporin related protein